MARVHYFQFLVNETGEPIAGADISIFLANSESPANIYTAESGGGVLNLAPQVTTLSNGFFQFWIADQSGTDEGYLTSQKFKLKWEKVGIAEGYIDHIDIFPAIKFVDGVDETDSTRTEKDKTVSNYLAYGWEEHKNHNIISDGLPVHGLDLINFQLSDEVPNKLMTNKLGWEWDQHRLSTVQTYNPSAGTPHGIEELQDGSFNTIRNKLVSNYDISQMRADINDLSGGVYTTDFQSVYNNTDPNISPYNPNIGFKMVDGKGFTIGDSTDSSFFTISSDALYVFTSGNLRADGGLDSRGLLTTIDTTDFTTTSQVLEFNSSDRYQGLMGNGEVPSYLVFDMYDGAWKIGSDLNSESFDEIIHEGNISLYISPPYRETITTASWTDNGDGSYSYNVNHNLNSLHPMVTVWNTDTSEIISTASVIQSGDPDAITITVVSPFNSVIRVMG